MKRLVGFEKGVNFGGWYSHENYDLEHFKTFITEADFERVAKWGLDHVRLTVDYNIFEDADGNVDETGFGYVQSAIDNCKKYGLNMILDLHKAPGFSYEALYATTGLFENEELQQKFYDLWEEFSKRFAKYDDCVAFELLNELTDPGYITTWNKMVAKTIEVIRKYSKNIKILVGSYQNNSIDAVKDLDNSADENVIYNFHCYDPLLFTHQAAFWVPEMTEDYRINYPGDIEQYRADAKRLGLDRITDHMNDTKFDKDYFIGRFKDCVKLCEERGTGLYCGEYGVISLADNEAILRWYKDINAAFEELGIGRAAWSYKEMDFGIGDPDKADIIDELVKYL